MSIFSIFAHWENYSEEAQRKALADVEKWLEEYDELKKENERLKAERRWVPASQPPDEGFLVITIDTFEWMELGYYRKGTWYHDSGGTRAEGMVTHWMPLPDEPQEGASDGN